MKKCKVIQLDYFSRNPLKMYDSIKEAQDEYHITHISEVCHGRRYSDGGYGWCYANPADGTTYCKVSRSYPKTKR